VTHRGPCQPPPFCDSVAVKTGARTRQNHSLGGAEQTFSPAPRVRQPAAPSHVPADETCLSVLALCELLSAGRGFTTVEVGGESLRGWPGGQRAGQRDLAASLVFLPHFSGGCGWGTGFLPATRGFHHGHKHTQRRSTSPSRLS